MWVTSPRGKMKSVRIKISFSWLTGWENAIFLYVLQDKQYVELFKTERPIFTELILHLLDNFWINHWSSGLLIYICVNLCAFLEYYFRFVFVIFLISSPYAQKWPLSMLTASRTLFDFFCWKLSCSFTKFAKFPLSQFLSLEHRNKW